jgi:hypothetical protein
MQTYDKGTPETRDTWNAVPTRNTTSERWERAGSVGEEGVKLDVAKSLATSIHTAEVKSE